MSTTNSIVFFSILLFMLLCFLYKSRNKIKYNLYEKSDSINSICNKKVVIDAFTYFQESIMLSIRLLRMNEFVDIFIIVVAETTYSGLPLNISFSPFESLISRYKKKIIVYNISFPIDCLKPWCRENYQRMAIPDAIKSLNINNESIVIISDLDEIPTSDAMKYILNNPPVSFYVLKGYIYYYNYRNRQKEEWPGVVVIKVSKCNRIIQSYRNNRYILSITHSIPIKPALTHCSFCYRNISLMQKKIHSFAHTEYNKPPYTTREYILHCIKSHVSIFDRKRFESVDYDQNLLPLPNDIRFDYLKEEFAFE